MSPPKSQRLDVVRKLAQQNEQQAAQILQDQRRRLDLETHQLQQLQTYYNDYLERIKKQTKVSVAEIITYREFSQRLADAVKKQELKIVGFKANMEKANKQWALLRKKRMAVEDIIENSRLEEQGDRDRAEQKLLDEIAGTLVATENKSNNGSMLGFGSERF